MFLKLNFLLVLVQVYFLIPALCDPIVQLPTGQILGREATTLENKKYYAFEGIPFAAPPVGTLRLKAPQPPESWDGILNNTFFFTICFQTSFDLEIESEDCLYLNVYTPQLPDQNSNVSLSVLFFMYGGAFNIGFMQMYGPDLFINNDVIIVACNYRLGIFGFLSTEDDIIPGNYGLKDQQMALRWTHENIHLFGGDPNKITITGHSAGSVSAAYHVLNQDNKGLFQGAILESGTSLSPCCLQRNARKAAFDAAAFIDSDFESNNDSQTLLDYLQSVDAKTLDMAGFLSYTEDNTVENNYYFQGLRWSPVIEVKNEGAVLTRKMYGLLEAGNFITVPILLGITSEEYISLLPNPSDVNDVKAFMQTYDEHVEALVPIDMYIMDDVNRTNMGELIRSIYTKGQPLADNLGAGIRLASDNIFTRSTVKFAELFSKFSKAYFYQFSYEGKLGNDDIHFDGAATVSHGEDIPYIYCISTNCDSSSYPESDRITRERLLALWTNFIKYQDPTPEPSDLLQNVTWLPLDVENGDFYYLDINETLEIRNHPKEEAYNAWIKLYDSLGYNDFDTY